MKGNPMNKIILSAIALFLLIGGIGLAQPTRRSGSSPIERGSPVLWNSDGSIYLTPNVGIGTTSAEATLTVDGTIYYPGYVSVLSSEGSDGVQKAITYLESKNGGTLKVLKDQTNITFDSTVYIAGNKPLHLIFDRGTTIVQENTVTDGALYIGSSSAQTASAIIIEGLSCSGTSTLEGDAFTSGYCLTIVNHNNLRLLHRMYSNKGKGALRNLVLGSSKYSYDISLDYIWSEYASEYGVLFYTDTGNGFNNSNTINDGRIAHSKLANVAFINAGSGNMSSNRISVYNEMKAGYTSGVCLLMSGIVRFNEIRGTLDHAGTTMVSITSDADYNTISTQIIGGGYTNGLLTGDAGDNNYKTEYYLKMSKNIVSSGGNIGIGSTSPVTALDVDGVVYIHPSRNVGIGTSVPRQALEVEGTTYFGTGNVGIGIDALNPRQTLDVDGTVYLEGNVGINTTNPLYKLSVNGSNYIAGTLTMAQRIVGASTLYIRGGSGGDLNLGSNAADGKLVVASGGNVGIASTAPRAKLDIEGTVYIAETGVAGAGAAMVVCRCSTGQLGHVTAGTVTSPTCTCP